MVPLDSLWSLAMPDPCLALVPYDSLAVPRLKASKCDAATLSGKLKSWLAKRGHYDLQMIMQPVERWGHSRAMPNAEKVIEFLDLAKVVYTLSPTLKLSHRDVYDALLELHSKIDVLPGINVFCSARKYSGLIRKPLEWYRCVAFYKEKAEIVFKDASDGQILIIKTLIDLLSRPASDAVAIVPLGIRKQKSNSSLCSSADTEMDMGMALDELASLGGDGIGYKHGNGLPQTSVFPEAAALCDELSSRGGSMVAVGVASGATVSSSMAKLCDELVAFGDGGDGGVGDELAPLPGGVGVLQRSITAAVKKNGKQAVHPRTPVATSSKASPKSVDKTSKASPKSVAKPSKASPKSVAKSRNPAQLAAYEKKKRKSRAWHAASDPAIRAGKSAHDANYAGRFASSITL